MLLYSQKTENTPSFQVAKEYIYISIHTIGNKENVNNFQTNKNRKRKIHISDLQIKMLNGLHAASFTSSQSPFSLPAKM